MAKSKYTGRKISEPFMFVNGEIEPFFEHRQPQKLNKCKYQLISFGIIRCSFVTVKYNREDVLKRLIKMGLEIASPLYNKDEYPNSFKIWVTENGVRELLICSRKHRQFINFLMS